MCKRKPSLLTRPRENINFVGGPYDNTVRKVAPVVTRTHIMLRDTTRKHIYRRNPNDHFQMLYEGEFERDQRELKYP